VTRQPRRSRAEIVQPEGASRTWPTVAVTALPEGDQELFRKRVRAVQMYQAGSLLQDIHEATGVDPSTISYLATRCTSVAPDGQIWGFRALIPNARIKPYKRIAPFRSDEGQGRGGFSGALQVLLDRLRTEGLEDLLVKAILRKTSELGIPEARIRAVDLHRVFIGVVRKLGVKEHEWPFTTEHLGLKTITSFMRDVLETNFAASVRARGERAAVAHLAVGQGVESFLLFEEPYEAFELDAYRINAHLTVRFKSPKGVLIPTRVNRLWLLTLVDRVATAIAAYLIVYRREVAAADVLQLFRRALTPWRPRELCIPGLKYAEGAGFPSGVFKMLSGALGSVLFLDGALANLSDAIRERARRELGFAINWGPVAHFERRPNVERTYKAIRDDVFGRLPSTTGSHPQSGRAPDAEVHAERLDINALEVEDIVDVYLAGHNATPSEGLSFLSPLEFLKEHVESRNFMPRRLPIQASTGEVLFPLRLTVQVRGSLKDGRRPYVQLDRVHYTSDVLRSAGKLIGKSVIIDVDEEDLRQVRAYLHNGGELGFLRAQGKWGTTKHDRRTRKAINRLIARRILFLAPDEDPVLTYLRYLSKKRQTRNKHKSESGVSAPMATEAARVAASAGVVLAQSPATEQRDGQEQAEGDDGIAEAMDASVLDVAALINKGLRK